MQEKQPTNPIKKADSTPNNEVEPGDLELLRTQLAFSERCGIFLIDSDVPDLTTQLALALADQINSATCLNDTEGGPEKIYDKILKRGNQCPDKKDLFLLDFRRETGFQGKTKEKMYNVLQAIRNQIYTKNNNLFLVIALDSDGIVHFRENAPDFSSVRNATLSLNHNNFGIKATDSSPSTRPNKPNSTHKILKLQ